MNSPYGILGMPGVGFFSLLIIGALAGWIAERVMNRNHSLLTNVLVGIAGSFVGGTLAGLLGQSYYGFIGNLVIATLGAVLILWFFGKREAQYRAPQQQGDSTYPQGGPMYHGKDEGRK